MRTNRDQFPLYLALLLAVSAAGLVALLAYKDIARELMQIVAMVAGAIFFSGLAILLSYAREPRSAPIVQITFNGRQLQEKLGKVIDTEFTSIDYSKNVPPIDAYADDDVVLALAKVRIDIEREIRRLATETGAIRSDLRFDLRRSIEMLAQTGDIPDVAVEAIRDILPVCNRAIHGEQIDTATARNVIGVARELMTILQGCPLSKTKR